MDKPGHLNRAVLLDTYNLAVGYGARIVAAGLNLPLYTGELVCLLGPNGVGKSTLMRTLAGLQRPLYGQVSIAGLPLHRLRAVQLAQQVSVVLTERVSVGMLKVFEVVGLGRHPYNGWSGKLSPRDRQVVQRAIDAVGIASLAGRSFSELSDGERQKVMIARALAQEPRLMILDEPTAFLDVPRRVEIMALLRRLAHEQQRTILISSHDLDLALRTADRVWLMRPGGEVLAGAPEDLVLSGAFQAAFRSEGARFDETDGSFRIEAVDRGRVVLQGDGVQGEWTRRALERAGFRVVPDDPADRLLVRVAADEDGTRWYLGLGSQVIPLGSIYDLIRTLTAALNRQPNVSENAPATLDAPAERAG